MARKVGQEDDGELDLNQLAHRLVREATEEEEGQRVVEPPPAEKLLPSEPDPDPDPDA